MNQRQSIQRITRLGIMIAVIFLMTFVPNIGYIQTGLLSITTIHIPVIVGSAILGPVGGLVLGATWGITSFLKVLSMPGTVETAIFLNPMVSIFPRILVGLIISYSTIALGKLIKNRDIKYALVAAIGTLSNTVLVLSSMFIFAQGGVLSFNQAFSVILTVIISTNGLFELISAIILVPIIIRAVSKVIPQS
jgi:uncharacterized membrane protein